MWSCSSECSLCSGSNLIEHLFQESRDQRPVPNTANAVSKYAILSLAGHRLNRHRLISFGKRWWFNIYCSENLRGWFTQPTVSWEQTPPFVRRSCDLTSPHSQISDLKRLLRQHFIWRWQAYCVYFTSLLMTPQRNNFKISNNQLIFDLVLWRLIYQHWLWYNIYFIKGIIWIMWLLHNKPVPY